MIEAKLHPMLNKALAEMSDVIRGWIFEHTDDVYEIGYFAYETPEKIPMTKEEYNIWLLL